MTNDLLTAIFQESLLIFLIIGSVFALLLGLLFLLSPQQGKALSERYNRWYSLRRPARALELPRSTEKLFYHQHQMVGLFILLSASYTLYQFAFNFDHDATLQVMTRLFGNALIIDWLLAATLWFFVPIAGLLLLFGATMALKPSALKTLEGLANRWVSTRKISQPLEKQYIPLDNWVQQQPRLFGILLILLAGYNLSVLLILFLNIIN